jgi:sugar phosphate isomerase/epimerase
MAPISVQLYSLRAEAATDFRRVLQRLGEIGFVGVELAGFHDLTPIEFSRVAADSGLVVSSGHLGDATPDALNASLDDLQTVGCDLAALAFLPPASFSDVDAVATSAELINNAASIAAQRGVSFGYHNHWWEFAELADGRTAWSHLIERLDPTVFIELDTYWTTVSGSNAPQVITDLGDRLRLIHVKDGPADDPEAPMVAVGSGSVDVSAIVHSATSAEWHVVELDRCATDMFDAVEGSYRWLTSQGLSAGRA